MFKFLNVTDNEKKEQRKIEYRNAFEEERKKRIFNPKQRILGIDLRTLAKQVEEKKNCDLEEERIKNYFDRQLISYDQRAVELERNELQTRREIEKEINNFRKNFQHFVDRREFDLNDPNAIKRPLKEKEISFALKFEGDSAKSLERLKANQIKYRNFLDQQLDEKIALEKEQEEKDNSLASYLLSNDRRGLKLDDLEKKCRKMLDEAYIKYNHALACEKQNEKDRFRKQESENNLAEMLNIMTSDLMTENPDVSISNFGSNRRIGYLYKGMSPAEREAIHLYQKNQKNEMDARRREEKKYSDQCDEYMNSSQRTIREQDMAIQKKIKEMNVELSIENLHLAAEQKNRQALLRKQIYNSAPGKEYFDNFNKTVR